MSWRNNTSKNNNQSGRVKFLTLFFMLAAFLIIARLFDLQVLRGNFYTALAVGQHELYKKLFPLRGSIYVTENDGIKRSLFPLVTNQDLDMLYAVPAEIVEPAAAAAQLFDILGSPEFDRKEIEKKLYADIDSNLDSKLAKEIKDTRWAKWLEEQKKLQIEKWTTVLSRKNDLYEPIEHKLTSAQVAKIKVLAIEGLYFQMETWRYYPEQGMGGHLFGFWGFNNNEREGQYGLEGYFNEQLAGKLGEIRSERDAWGNLIAIGSNSFEEKKDGSSLVLTIDRAIQYKACQTLYAAIQRFKAVNGSVIVMNPKTGAIIAMCGYPDFDPAVYGEVKNSSAYNNPAIFQAYEPGSIFKAVTMAVALDVGQVEPQTTFEDTGEIIIGKDKIHNFNNKSYGRQNMTEVLENSINTGAVWAMRQATPKVFVKYVKDFGFGEKTGVDLDTEVGGDISNLDRSSEIYAATASYGQGILVTPLQMVTAYAAIANGGKLMKPYVVAQIINDKGQIVETEAQEVRQAISSKTSRILSAMLVSVVESGHGKPASVSGYRIAGKTGTAQVAKKTGGYSDDVDTSFAGFGPFNDPKFAMIVTINRPQIGKEAVITAAPVFGDIAKFILQYYNIPYDSQK